MAKTDKFNKMIEAFECDFILAKNRQKSLGSLDISIFEKEEKLMADIDLLEELSYLLRYGKAEIHLIEEPKTRADKIRAMDDAELAKFASHYISCGYCDANNGKCGYCCEETLLKWLQSEAE